MMTGKEEPRALHLLRHPVTILAALAGGAALGLYAPRIGLSLMTAAQVYLILLQMTIVPILVFSVSTGVAELAARPHAGRLLARAAIVLTVVLVAAAGIGLAAGIIGRPGRDISDARAEELARIVRGSSQETDITLSLSTPRTETSRQSIFSMLTQIVPRNIFASLSAGSIIQILFFALIFGLAVGLLRESQKTLLLDVGQRALDGFMRFNLWLIYLLPLGAVAIVSYLVASSGMETLAVIGKFLVTLAAALGAGVFLFFIAAWARTRKPLRLVISAFVEPLTYALITADSIYALPYALRAFNGRLGYERETANTALPVAMVLGRAGYALYFVLAGIFIAEFYGVPLFATDYLILAAGAVVAAVGTAGNGAAGSLAMMGFALGPLGLPADPIVTVFAGSNFVIAPFLALFETQASMTASLFMARRHPRASGERAPIRRESLRVAIVALLASLIIITGLVTIGLMYSGQRRNIEFLTDGTIGEISARVVQRTESYFSHAERANASLQYLMDTGVFPPADRPALIDYMRQELTANPEFASMYYGSASGDFTMVKRMPDGSFSNRIITRTEDTVVVVWTHDNPQYASAFPSGRTGLSEGYDPRTRVWYKGAVDSTAATHGPGVQEWEATSVPPAGYWTNVYLFASDNMLGISHAVAIRPAGQPRAAASGVLAVDIGLAELSYFLGALDISESGKTYILNEKNEIIALSMPRDSDLAELFSGSPTGSASSTANLVLADEARDPLVRQSFLSYLWASRKDASFSVQTGNGRYISRITDFPSGSLFHWKIGVVIPEKRIYEYVDQTSRIVLYAAFLIIVTAIGLGVSFSRTITQPLRILSREMERIRTFELGRDEPISSRIKEIDNMAGAFMNMKHGLSAFNKYVPSKLVAQLIKLGEEPRIGGQRRTVTLFFSDVADFTTISESLTPEDLVDQMATYFSALSREIIRRGGTVDKYIGDSIMAFWNAPVLVSDHPMMACVAALGCQEALTTLRANDNRPGHLSLFQARTRMGIHTGEAVIGNMGSEERLNYTAVGDSVNLASRLEGLNKSYGTSIIISETTYAEVRHLLSARLLDRVAVKGRYGSLHVYELMATLQGQRGEDREFAETATRAVEAYLSRDFPGALGLIRKAQGIRPDDPAIRLIKERCNVFTKSPPPPDWDGVYIHHEK